MQWLLAKPVLTKQSSKLAFSCDIQTPKPLPSATSHREIPALFPLPSQSHLSPWTPGTLDMVITTVVTRRPPGYMALLLAMQMWFQAPQRQGTP